MSNEGYITRVMVADDHHATREGLCALLERERNMQVVAQAGDGEEAVALFRVHHPQLALMDLHMPGLDGLKAAAAILEESPRALIVALTSYDGDARVARALALGARSYLLKTSHPSVLKEALHRVLRGEIVVDPRLEQTSKTPREPLTNREISVVKLIAQGNPNRDIGLSLNISENTVKARIKSVLIKLGARDRTHAVTLARDRGFLDF